MAAPKGEVSRGSRVKRLYGALVGALGLLATVISLLRAPWDAQPLQTATRLVRVLAPELAGLVALLCVAVLGVKKLGRHGGRRSRLSLRDQVVAAVIGALLIWLGVEVFQLESERLRLALYLAGPGSVVALEESGDFTAAAKRADYTAGIHRWRYLREDLLKAAQRLRNKAALRQALQETYVRVADRQAPLALLEMTTFARDIDPTNRMYRDRLDRIAAGLDTELKCLDSLAEGQRRDPCGTRFSYETSAAEALLGGVSREPVSTLLPWDSARIHALPRNAGGIRQLTRAELLESWLH